MSKRDRNDGYWGSQYRTQTFVSSHPIPLVNATPDGSSRLLGSQTHIIYNVNCGNIYHSEYPDVLKILICRVANTLFQLLEESRDSFDITDIDGICSVNP